MAPMPELWIGAQTTWELLGGGCPGALDVALESPELCYYTDKCYRVHLV